MRVPRKILSNDEREKYDRQILLRQVGEEGQVKIKNTKVFIAGVGGLGSLVCTYLAAAGLGALIIADHDTVELSNLNRQILHWQQDIGRRKVDSAWDKLRNFNPDIRIKTISETIGEHNAVELVADADAIVDAMDNLPTRYLLNRVAISKKIPFFHGAVYGFEGRLTTIIPGQTACLGCMYRGPVPHENFPVIGVTPAVIGALQATEVIKYILGLGELLTNRLLSYDGIAMKFTEFKLKRNPNCTHCSHLPRKE